jgi:hypothetical protein
VRLRGDRATRVPQSAANDSTDSPRVLRSALSTAAEDVIEIGRTGYRKFLARNPVAALQAFRSYFCRTIYEGHQQRQGCPREFRPCLSSCEAG